MPLLTTCAILAFKPLIKFAARNLCEAVVPGTSDIANGLIGTAIDKVGDTLQHNYDAPVPYWELGKAECDDCGAIITRGCVSHCVTCGDFDLCAKCISHKTDRTAQFHDPGHMWTIYMLSKDIRGYANLDSKPSVVTRRSPKPVGYFSGHFHCTGFYMQFQIRTALALKVAFAGPNGSDISGRGADAIGAFTIHGRRNGSHVSFLKRYQQHAVVYDGAIVDGTLLVGTWSIQGYIDSGPFVLVLELVDSKVEAVERATWSGFYEQCRGRYRTSVNLSIFASGRIEGKGQDSVGSKDGS